MDNFEYNITKLLTLEYITEEIPNFEPRIRKITQ